MSRNVALEGRYIENSIEYIIFEANVLLNFIHIRNLQNSFLYFVIFTHFWLKCDLDLDLEIDLDHCL